MFKHVDIVNRVQPIHPVVATHREPRKPLSLEEFDKQKGGEVYDFQQVLNEEIERLDREQGTRFPSCSGRLEYIPRFISGLCRQVSGRKDLK